MLALIIRYIRIRRSQMRLQEEVRQIFTQYSAGSKNEERKDQGLYETLV